MRAFNDGRFLETELKLLESGKGITWGFALGQIRTSAVMLRRTNPHRGIRMPPGADQSP